MRAVVFSPKAEADIDHIYDYTEDHWGFEKAEAYTFGLQEVCNALAEGSRRGKRIEGKRRAYQALAYNAHFIVYRENDHQVVIVRVLHQRMNLRRHL